MFFVHVGMFVASVGHIIHHRSAAFSSSLHACYENTLVQLGRVSPRLALYIFIVRVLFMFATVRIRCVVKRSGMFVASIGHANHHCSVALHSFLQKACVF